MPEGIGNAGQSKGIIRSLLRLYRDAYSNHPQEIWVLAGLTFINRFGTMILPFLTVYLTSVEEFTLQDAGLLAGAFGLGSFTGSFIGGKLTDSIGARKVIIGSLIISGFLLICLQWMHSFVEIFALIYMAASFGEAYRPALMATVAEFVPAEKTARTMSLIRMAINTGFAAGPAMAGLIVTAYGYHWIFWIDGLTCIFAGSFFLLASKNWKNHHHKGAESENNDAVQVNRRPFRDREYLMFCLATLILGFSFMQWFNSVPVFIKSEWGFDERYIGLLFALNGIVLALFEMPVIHWIEKAGKINIGKNIGLLFILFSFLPFFLPNALPIAFLAMLIMTIGEMLYLPLNSAEALKLSPQQKRGEYMAWYGMTWAAAHILSPTLGLGLIGWFGYDSFWLVLMIAMLISIYLFNRGTAESVNTGN